MDSAKSSDESSASSSSDESSVSYQLATHDYANGVATDSSGNVYVVGGTKGERMNGVNIGNNMSLDDAKKEVGQVAEGLRTLMVIKNDSLKQNINMPLVESLYNIIYENLQPQDLISDLINNPHEVDVEFKL